MSKGEGKFKDTDSYTKLILHQIDGISVEFVQQGASLLIRKMLKAPLQHAAAIRVSGQVKYIATESVDETETVG
jgi:hypothetical protein